MKSKEALELMKDGYYLICEFNIIWYMYRGEIINTKGIHVMTMGEKYFLKKEVNFRKVNEELLCKKEMK